MSYSLDKLADRLVSLVDAIRQGEVEVVRTDPNEQETTWSVRRTS